MTVHIDEMTTDVETAPAATPATAAGGREDTVAGRERARRAAERAARIARRTHAEGYDD